MTYGKIFQYGSCQANQCSARTFKQAPGFSRSCTATCQGLWDVYATSVSIFTGSATTATTCGHSGTKDTFHGQVNTQHRHGTTATRNQPEDAFGRSSSTRDRSLSASGTAAWLKGNSQREHYNWNTVLIVYSARNYHKLINCWYQKNHVWLSTQ